MAQTVNDAQANQTVNWNPVTGWLGGATRQLTQQQTGAVSTYTQPVTRPTTAPKVSTTRSSAADAAAAAAANATKAANTASRNAATQQRSTLQQQIDANNAQISTNQTKLDALSDLIAKGLAGARDVNLAAIDAALKTLLDQSKAHYDTQLGDLNTSLRDNERSESDSSFQNLANRAREKQDLVTQALSQGAGESDVLKSQLQALRNWQGNQGDINRSYFDTLTSTNGSINDLNTGTQTSMTNAELDANAKRSSVWGDFYGGISDAYTQMDNLATNNYLLQGENAAARANMGTQDSLLSWIDSGKDASAWTAPTAQTAGSIPAFTGYAQQAADYAGKAWADPGVSDATKNWQGQQTQVGNLATSQAWDAQANSSSKGAAAPKRPEGATLRRW